jgi:Glycosyltransferases involved in cell wall biogenesis
MSEQLDISLIIPAKDEQESIPELTNWISRVMQEHGFSYEVIFIDDGSTDGTWEEIVKGQCDQCCYKRFSIQSQFREVGCASHGLQSCAR